MKDGTNWLERLFMGVVVSSGSDIGRGKKISWEALGLVANVLVLWNTLYMNAALDHLRFQGIDVRPEDVRRLKPFLRKHINFLGRYNFTTSESIQNGSLRSLYVPESPLEKELD